MNTPATSLSGMSTPTSSEFRTLPFLATSKYAPITYDGTNFCAWFDSITQILLNKNLYLFAMDKECARRRLLTYLAERVSSSLPSERETLYLLEKDLHDVVEIILYSMMPEIRHNYTKNVKNMKRWLGYLGPNGLVEAVKTYGKDGPGDFY